MRWRSGVVMDRLLVPLCHQQYSIGYAHSTDVLPRSVPDRSRVEIGNLVEEKLCRPKVGNVVEWISDARGVVTCVLVGAIVFCDVCQITRICRKGPGMGKSVKRVDGLLGFYLNTWYVTYNIFLKNF